MRHLTLFLFPLVFGVLELERAQAQEAGPSAQGIYKEICDASTAVAIGSDRFLVSNDEKNKLWLYQLDKPDPAAPEFDISAHLTLQGDKEADIEGSAMLGETLYWITSHGRNKKGELLPNRYQLFVLTPKQTGNDISLVPTGKPYTRLMEDMLAAIPELKLPALTPAPEPSLAPEAKGTNIEGLAAWKDDQLLIAFRNPVPNGKALLVPLENPAKVTLDGETARFGKLIQLDLGGLGIRSIELWKERGTYMIVAGAFDDCPAFQLFLWSGNPTQPPLRLPDDLFGLRPEAIVTYPDRKNEILLLSDDGGVLVNGTECKDLPKAQRSFRTRWISLPPQP
jgi:hypothetical protein